MAEKKGFLASLFGGGKCDCGMSIEDESVDKKPAKKKDGCCDMQIIEEEATSGDGTQAPKAPDASGSCCGK